MDEASSFNYVRDLMTFVSRVKWIGWRSLNQLGVPCCKTIQVKLSEGAFIRLSHATHNVSTAHEVFLSKHYDRPWLEVSDNSWVIDLGGNVGYSTVDFAIRWPNCRILTVEPVPGHVAEIAKHIEINGLAKRVEVIQAAAGTQAGVSNMIIDGVCSRLTSDESSIRSNQVDVIDVFETIKSRQPIGLIKIDIEGGEFAILSDERFKLLEVRVLIVEWHDYGLVEDPRGTVIALIENAGLQIVEEVANPPHGMIYAKA